MNKKAAAQITAEEGDWDNGEKEQKEKEKSIMHKEGLYISRKRIRDKWKERKGVWKIKTGRKSWVEDLYMSKTGKSIKWMTERERKKMDYSRFVARLVGVAAFFRPFPYNLFIIDWVTARLSDISNTHFETNTKNIIKNSSFGVCRWGENN